MLDARQAPPLRSREEYEAGEDLRHRGNGHERVDVYADDTRGVDSTHVRGDERTLVTPLDPIAFVTEPAHQGGECARNARVSPPGPAERSREAVARNRWNHEMEGVGRVPATRTRIGQWADHVEELDDRSGPSVDEHQRGGVRLAGTHVQEVNVLAVDRGGELWVSVELGLVCAPIVGRAPVLGQLPQVALRDAAAPPPIRNGRSASTGASYPCGRSSGESDAIRPRRRRRAGSLARRVP